MTIRKPDSIKDFDYDDDTDINVSNDDSYDFNDNKL
jgi:hypothetical protein